MNQPRAALWISTKAKLLSSKRIWRFSQRIVQTSFSKSTKKTNNAPAKDARVDPAALNDVGILATPLEHHTPKLPGLGDIDWGRFFSVLGQTGYSGPECIEVENRPCERTLAGRQGALRQSVRNLRIFHGRRIGGDMNEKIR